MTNTTENVIDLVQQQMQKAHQPGESYTIEELVGGAERDRTVDLLNAIYRLPVGETPSCGCANAKARTELQAPATATAPRHWTAPGSSALRACSWGREKH